MREEEIKAFFPEGIETITITKNDYDRLYGQMTYENIILQQKVEQLEKELKEANESITWWSNRFKAVERDNKQLENIRKEAIDLLIYVNYNIRGLEDKWLVHLIDKKLNILNKGSDKE